VTNRGRICIKKRKVNLSRVFAGQDVGVKEVNEGIWLVFFMNYDLGYFDLESQKIEPLEYPFAPEMV
jgi:putative transposase